MTEEKEVKFTVYVGKDGRMTVPKGARDALGIKEGDLVECTIRKVKVEQSVGKPRGLLRGRKSAPEGDKGILKERNANKREKR